MWLDFKDISTGTKLRTLFSALAALVGAYYAYKGIVDDLLHQLGWDKSAIIVALIAAIGLIIAEAASTYYNNDYSKGAAIGTAIGREYNRDPTTVVLVDSDEDDDDEDEADVEVE